MSMWAVQENSLGLKVNQNNKRMSSPLKEKTIAGLDAGCETIRQGIR